MIWDSTDVIAWVKANRPDLLGVAEAASAIVAIDAALQFASKQCREVMVAAKAVLEKVVGR